MIFKGLKSDEGLDILLEIMGEVEKITSSADYQQYVENAREKKKSIGDNTVARLLYKDFRAETYHIIALVNGKTVEEIRKQDYTDTMKQMREVLKDPEIASFFV